MPIEKITPVLNVRDIGQSFTWFEHLGWKRSFSWNDAGLIGDGESAAAANEHGPAGFGGVCSDEVTLFLCCGGQGPRGTALPAPADTEPTDGVWMTWWVSSKEEVDRLYDIAVANQMTVTHPPTDEPWGVREFHLRHPDGHVFRVSCGIESSSDD